MKKYIFKPKQITESNTKVKVAKDLEIGDWLVFEGKTESTMVIDALDISGGIVRVTLEHCSGTLSNSHYKTSDKVTIVPRRTHTWGVGGTNLYFHF